MSETSIIKGAEVSGVIFCYPHLQRELSHPSQPIETSFPDDTTKKRWYEEGYNAGREEGQRQGYEAGRAEGIEVGYQEAFIKVRKESSQMIYLIDRSAEEFRISQIEIFDRLKPELINLCFAICEKILRDLLESPKLLEKLLLQFFSEARSIMKEVPVDLYFSSADFEAIKKDLDLIQRESPAKSLRFNVDPTLEKGDWRIESSLGLFKFDIKRFLSDMKQKILAIEPERDTQLESS